VSQSRLRFCGTISFIFDSYFNYLELLKIIFIFVTTLSVLSMNRYDEVTLKRNNNRYDRIEINVLVTN
jgi:hypothetical protein